MYKICLAAVITATVLFAQPVHAQQASREEVLSLMAVMGLDSLGKEITDELMPELKAMLPEAPEKFWNEVRGKLNASKLVEQMIPIYQRYLTSADIAAIMEFYSTPSGKKLVQFQDRITQESYRLGEEWGAFVVEQVILKYEREVGPLQ